MSRIPAVNPLVANGKAKDLLNAVQKGLGVTPNLFRVTAQSPATLEGLLGLNRALAEGAFGARQREAIALAVAEANGCDYCLSAHSYLGKSVGLTEVEMTQARHANADDQRLAATLRFARLLVQRRGQVTDADIAALRQAGLSDADVIEVVGNVVVNIFTNYINHVAATDIDFPEVRAEKAKAA